MSYQNSQVPNVGMIEFEHTKIIQQNTNSDPILKQKNRSAYEADGYSSSTPSHAKKQGHVNDRYLSYEN